MKEHENESMLGVLGERDEGEDMIVDVVGAAVDDHHHETIIEKFLGKETETEQVSGSVGIRVLNSEEGLKSSVEGDIVTAVSIESKSEVTVIKSMTEESVEEDKISDSSKIEVGTVVVEESFGSKDEAEAQDSVTVNNIVASSEVLNGGEVGEKIKDESMGPVIEDITNDAQADTDGDAVVNEKIGKENEGLDSSVSESSNVITPGSEDVNVVVVDDAAAVKEGARYDVPSDPKFESASGEPQFGGETAVIEKEETKRDLNKDEEFVEPSAESVQEVAYGDAMDNITEKEDKVLDSSNVPESLITVNLGLDKVLTKKNEGSDGNSPDLRVTEADDEGQSCKVELPMISDMSGHVEEQGLKVEAANTGSIIDPTVCKISNSNVEERSAIEVNGFQVPADTFDEIDGVTPIGDIGKQSEYSFEDAEGMDIDEVLGWKDDDTQEIDVISGAENDQHNNKKSEAADVEQRLPESSCEPVLIGHQEENLKSQKPIVYGRRAHVEVPVYDSLDGSGSPLLEDENIAIETDSDEEEKAWHESLPEQELPLTEPSVPGSSYSLHDLHQSRYFQPPEREGEFSVSDLVWGKVRSHPWWPGQIVDPSHASHMAMKYHKKDCFLVAYFGDGTFAWNDSSVLKPFRANFSQIEKNTNLEAFKNAVKCALDEVTRRVELGLACSCVSKDVYKKMECQVIENGGVKKKYFTRRGKDESCSSSSFEPDKLVAYVKSLAQFPGDGDKMELAMAKAQLSSYCRFKGYRKLPEFHIYGDLLEDVEKLDKNVEKFENNVTENANPNKEVSLSDLTDDAPESGHGDIITSKSVSSSGYKKRKAHDSVANGSVKRQNRQPHKVSTPPIATPKPSFKIGALIQRVASQLTGPTPLKSNTENGQHVDLLADSPAENIQTETSVADMLSQLLITAQDPMKRYGFLQNIIPFFYARRASVFTKSLKRNHPPVEVPDSANKRKATDENDPEEFEFQFDEINDCYWTDRVIQNPSEDPLQQQDHQNGGIDYQQVVGNEPDKPAKRGRKKRVFSSDHKREVKVESEADKRRRENLATEIVLRFAEGVYFPREIQLNKMFKRFGSLMESETEVDSQGGRARVVFKKCCDAEVAHSSAGKINIFGSIAVNYELNYTPLVSYKPLPLLLCQNPMDAS